MWKGAIFIIPKYDKECLQNTWIVLPFRYEKTNWCQKAKILDKVLSNTKKRHEEGCQK